jgi:hypothetical protein
VEVEPRSSADDGVNAPSKTAVLREIIPRRRMIPEFRLMVKIMRP